METFYAVLNCTKYTSPNLRIAILVTKLSTDMEYVRMGKKLSGGRTLIELSQLERFTKRQVRVPLEPTESPLNLSYGFWLRALKPPGYKNYQVHVLSRSVHSEIDKVFLEEGTWGTAGIVYLEPKPKGETRDQIGLPEIRWLKLGFDQDFNPILLLAEQPRYIRRRSTEDLLRQASRSEANSQVRDEVFHNQWIGMEAPLASRAHGWSPSKGIIILKVDRQKGMSGSIAVINLGISFKLITAPGPNQIPTNEIDEGLRQIWAVDITDIGKYDPERDVVEAYEEIWWTKIWTNVWTILCCGITNKRSETTEMDRNSAHRLK